MLFLLSRRAFSFLASVVFFNRLQKYQLSLAKKMFGGNFGQLVLGLNSRCSFVSATLMVVSKQKTYFGRRAIKSTISIA